MRGSKLGPQRNVAFTGKQPSREPLEAKSGPLELMTLSNSHRQDNPDNYSGEGKDQDWEEVNAPSSTRTVLGEEKEIEGSSEGSFFSGASKDSSHNVSSSNVNPETEPSPRNGQNELEAEHTTLAQWQLVEQPSTSSTQGSQEPETAEEARGEILYVHRPTDNLSSASTHGGESSSNGGWTPVFRKHSKDMSRAPSRGEAEAVTPSPEAFMEVLTTSEGTTGGFLTRTDVLTTATAETPSTEEPHVSISSTERKMENTSGALSQSRISPTSAPSEVSHTASGAVQRTTVTQESTVAITEMGSRSAVSESSVLGSHWNPLKGMSPKSEDHRVTTESKATNNPFGLLVPNWAFGLIPSGRC